MRLLIVDDNEEIHLDIRKVLGGQPAQHKDIEFLEQSLFGKSDKIAKRPEFRIDSAYQGADACEFVEKALAEGDPYSVAFVDVRMPPGWDGVTTAEHLWRIDPTLQIVICTAYSDHSWEQMAERLERTDAWLVLKKPFDTVELLQFACSLAKKWELHKQVASEIANLQGDLKNRVVELEQVNGRLLKEAAERAAAQEDVRFFATHDALTGLPNRALLKDRLEQAISRSRRQSQLVGVLMLDVDEFKEINDRYGQAHGDKVLQAVAGRLTESAREYDTVARLAGDTFVVILVDVTEPDYAGMVAQRILDRLREPINIDGIQIAASLSIGVSIFPADGDDVEGLLKASETALYEARKVGGTICFYDVRVGHQTRARSDMRDELRRALKDEEFQLWYQPLIDTTTGLVGGMEALLRWIHPERGIISPMDFIPIAEESGLIVPMGEWVLRTACRQNAAWQRSGKPAVPIAVNVSPRQLQQDSLNQLVSDVLRETGLAPKHLELEVTETAAMRDVSQSRATLNELHDLGVQIVIDDFGAGYSSLNRLRSLSVDGIKVDRLFINNLFVDARDQAIVKAIIALAHSLGLHVVAEGIETAEQMRFIEGLSWRDDMALPCQRVQGFLFSKPVPAAEVELLFGKVFWQSNRRPAAITPRVLSSTTWVAAKIDPPR